MDDLGAMKFVKDKNGRVLVEDGVGRKLQWFYEKLLNEENVRKPLWEVWLSNNITRPITAVETLTVLKMMKCEKAVGLDGVLTEAFKTLGHQGVVVMTNIFNVLLCIGKMPNAWRKSTLVPIFRCKGDVQECNN